MNPIAIPAAKRLSQNSILHHNHYHHPNRPLKPKAAIHISSPFPPGSLTHSVRTEWGSSGTTGTFPEHPACNWLETAIPDLLSFFLRRAECWKREREKGINAVGNYTM